MIIKMVKKSKLFHERNNNPAWCSNYFDLKTNNFLHNVDTFYYSVKIESSKSVFAYFINHLELQYTNVLKSGYAVSEIDTRLVSNGFKFNIYKYDLEYPDEFLYLFADKVPNENTPYILVQIRSYALWVYGMQNAFDKSLYTLKDYLSHFGIKIIDANVNRIDYCWHTNYFQDVQRFINIDNIRKMKVTRFKEWDTRGRFVGASDIEADYIRLGRLKSNNCLFRCYLKSKEVVQMGYKPWFLQIWLLHGLINRFDYYCYEYAFKQHNWDSLNKARMLFYLEYGSDQVIKDHYQKIIDDDTMSYSDICKALDGVVPEVTLILNFEYQVMRKFLVSIDVKPFQSNLGDYEVYKYIDLRKSITDYLTHDVLRFVRKGDDSNKSRAGYAPFWERLRNTKFITSGMPEDRWPIVREYTKHLNAESVKMQSAKLACTLSAYNARLTSDVSGDIIAMAAELNDNDLARLKQYKQRKIDQLGLKEDFIDITEYAVLNTETGEIF